MAVKEIRSQRALGDGGSRRVNERLLEAAHGVQMIAGPDYLDTGCGGVPVGVAQVVGDRLDEPTIGHLVGCEWIWHCFSAGEAGGELVVPPRHV